MKKYKTLSIADLSSIQGGNNYIIAPKDFFTMHGRQKLKHLHMMGVCE
ncbi:bacteriocin [Lactobacillus sp. ESL0681]|nr:bacteriocin [Lactobacillus sp. ESL0681]WEV40243.1 bacteriocin [Lactobacillus sp. ESL0681]